MNLRPLMLGYVRDELAVDADETERRLQEYAYGEGFCLTQAHHDAGPTTGALWVLANELEHSNECRDLLVPARAHLDSAPNRALVQRLWKMTPAIRLWSLLEREDRVVLRRHRPRVNRPYTALTVLDEFRCPATYPGESIAQLHARESLARAGLREMVSVVDTVVSALVGEAIEATRERVSRVNPDHMGAGEAAHPLGGEAFADLRVRLLISRATELVVEVVELREHARDHVPAALVPLARYGRYRLREGGTLTWCALPLAATWTDLARTVHTHLGVAGGVR